MIKSLLITGILLGCFNSGISAQNSICRINGTIGDRHMRLAKDPITKVYLNRMDETEQFIIVDSAEIKANGSFTLSYDMAADPRPVVGHITGFDNGLTTLWMEPGEVKVEIKEARYPSGAKVSGTATNELAAQYKALREQCIRTQTDFIREATNEHGAAWLEEEEGIQQRTEIGNKALMQQLGDEMTFLLDHPESPLTPLMLQKEIMFHLDEFSLNRMLNAMSPALKGHPYYTAARNAILAKFLKIGGEVPDIQLPTVDGQTMHLSDLNGQYILLDFWASWCGPCRKEIPYLIKLFNETKDKRNQFTIVSYSIDNDDKAWRQAINDRGMNLEGWIHASDLKGWQSPQAQMFGVDAVPKTVLISPDGKVIAFDLRGEEMIRTVKQLLDM